MEKYEGRQNENKHFQKARIYEEINNLNLALQEIKTNMERSRKKAPDGVLSWQDHYAYLLAMNGDVDGGESEDSGGLVIPVS